ncbi:hypothetical protein M2163_001112 [Streptomyces sp. SAI-135]|uniref:hypothetical protein n=1 Tax=Streptomyces sp. SAI-135 TaxID=2940549 RepID=UPI002473DD6D|nr:hypothetical protein [Streptomyces sp. SAI-135]MDH6614004.1 hypothetical protein [Streptomyces sp. SAI-135]
MTTTERVLFALVANRALAPASSLAAAEWITNPAYIDHLAETVEQRCHRAMDWLHEMGRRPGEAGLQRRTREGPRSGHSSVSSISCSAAVLLP